MPSRTDASTGSTEPHSQPAPTADPLPRVVVIGAGFGGVAATLALRRAAADVTWIDRRNHHLFQPLLYQVATAALSPADIAAPVREIARHCPNVRVLMGEVVAIDRAERTVRTREQTIPYDYLVVATGSETSFFGNDAWAQNADGLKDLDEAVTIRRKVLLALERAETAQTEAERRRLLTFVLIGAGPTGVEMAGAIADLAKHELTGDFPTVRPDLVSVVLIEAMDHVLPPFPKDLAAFAHRKLTEMGVDVRVGTKVERIDESGVVAGGERIEANVVIWSAGVKATPVGRWLGVETDRRGRVDVSPDLSVPGDPHVFVIGDAACALGKDGSPLPGLAAVAKQQGTYVGRRIAAVVAKRDPKARFRYRNWGVLATMGRASAVANFGRLRLRGFGAWLVWVAVHIWYLIAFRNRMRVLINWAWQYLAFSPGARLITGIPSGSQDVREGPREEAP